MVDLEQKLSVAVVGAFSDGGKAFLAEKAAVLPSPRLQSKKPPGPSRQAHLSRRFLVLCLVLEPSYFLMMPSGSMFLPQASLITWAAEAYRAAPAVKRPS
jgi:hypothetical protein